MFFKVESFETQMRDSGYQIATSAPLYGKSEEEVSQGHLLELNLGATKESLKYVAKNYGITDIHLHLEKSVHDSTSYNLNLYVPRKDFHLVQKAERVAKRMGLAAAIFLGLVGGFSLGVATMKSSSESKVERNLESVIWNYTYPESHHYSKVNNPGDCALYGPCDLNKDGWYSDLEAKAMESGKVEGYQEKPYSP